MHREEAQWIADRLASIDPEKLNPLLNIGSSTEEFRRVQQPHIDALIFEPLRRNEIRVVHLDIKEGPGVDLIGDLTDPGFLKQLKLQRFRTVLCSNLLEHIENPCEVAKAIVEIVHDGGFIMVTVPMVYPKHLDPIDTMYRPTPAELANLFSGTILIDDTALSVRKVWSSFSRNWLGLIHLICRASVPLYKHRGWITAVHKLAWLFRERKIACAFLERVGSD